MKRHPLYPVAAVLAAMTTMAAMALPSSAGAATVKVSATSLNNTYAAMKLLKPLVSKGHGKVAALLPTTTTSTRYVEFDAPDLAQAFKTAGLSTSEYEIQNAQGSDATELTDAQTDITNGASVLLVDPLDSGVGAQIESYAKAHGVGVIDYDRLTLGGSRTYYVSFTNVRVGTLLGKGLASCVTAWHVSSPKVVVMHGAVTDNNATLFAQGYNAVMKPYFTSGKWSDVTNPAGTWTPPQALTEFQAAYTAHPTINAALIPNDENATPIITYLRQQVDRSQDLPDHRSGRHLDGAAERAVGLPVRDGLQADLPGGPGGGGAGHVHAGRCHASEVAGERQDDRHPRERLGALGPPHPRVGDDQEHGRHCGQGQLRAGLLPMRRCLRGRLPESWDLGPSVRA